MASRSAASLVDGGRFDWEASGKFPTLTEPYAGYHGIDFAEEFGPPAFIMRARAEGLRDFGACMSPHNAFHILQGVETLPLRMDAPCRQHRARSLEFLPKHPAVAWVHHPDLPEPSGPRAGQAPAAEGRRLDRQLRHQGRPRAGAALHRGLQLFSHLANVGDAKSLVIHPACTTHQQMDAPALEAAGVGEDMIRLSVGLEDAGDMIADLDQALRASQSARRGVAPMELDRRRQRAFAADRRKGVDAARPTIGSCTAPAWTTRSGPCRRAIRPSRPQRARARPARPRPQRGPPCAPSALADWLIEALDAAGATKAALVGHWMGALVALEAAARAPDARLGARAARRGAGDAGPSRPARRGQVPGRHAARTPTRIASSTAARSTPSMTIS